MPWKEWSLIINSLMIQLAAGILTFLAISRLVLGGNQSTLSMTSHGFVLVGPSILTGMIVSLFHLGHPLRAYRATSNLRTSWLSREVLFTALFFLFWIACCVLENAGNPSVVMTWATVGAGLLSVLSMSDIYTSTGIKGWHGWNTFWGFFGTVIVLGSIGSALIVVNAGHSWEGLNGMVITSVLAALLMLAIRFASQLRLIRTMESTDEQWSLDHLAAAQTAVSSTQDIVPLYKTLTLWAGMLSLAGIGLSLFLLMTTISNALLLAMLAFGLLLMGELLGRVGFYSLWREPDQMATHHRSDRDVYGRYLRP